MIIRIEQQWQTLTTEFHNSDVGLEQIFDAFKGMLISCTWQQETIEDYILELAESIKELRQYGKSEQI
jgi:hypothetical protein